jgi:hypothetical protein
MALKTKFMFFCFGFIYFGTALTMDKTEIPSAASAEPMTMTKFIEVLKPLVSGLQKIVDRIAEANHLAKIIWVDEHHKNMMAIRNHPVLAEKLAKQLDIKDSILKCGLTSLAELFVINMHKIPWNTSYLLPHINDVAAMVKSFDGGTTSELIKRAFALIGKNRTLTWDQ